MFLQLRPEQPFADADMDVGSSPRASSTASRGTEQNRSSSPIRQPVTTTKTKHVGRYRIQERARSTSSGSEVGTSANMSSSSGTPESWISSFCSLLGHEYFAEISEDFIEDDFNLTGLQTQVAMYKEALEVILLLYCPANTFFR
jgi:hypothetical protein